MKALVRRLTTPFGAIWVLCHTIMILVGVLFLNKTAQTLIGVGLSEGIGGSLIASGVAGISLFLYIATTDTLKLRAEMFTKAGLSGIYSGRSVLIRHVYEERLSSAKRIDLVGYGLSSFRQDFLKDFVTWSRKAHVRILLIDPDFPTPGASFADLRDKEENHPVGRTRDDVHLFESAVSELPGLRRSNFKVHRVRCIPAINVFRIDDDIFWGPYLMHQQSRNTPTLLVSRGGFMFEVLQEHFEALWKQSSPSPTS